jgi:hypothetical protein
MEDLPNNQESFDIQKSPMRDAYLMLGATTPLELSQAYTKLENPIFISRVWDYDDPDQPQNKIKEMLEVVDEGGLTEDEKEWRKEILWFWYHHAISVAGWKRDKEKMKVFSEKAMEYEDPSNMLTRTMYLLAHDRIEEAEEWADSKAGDVDEDTAREMIENYKKIGWLWSME